jgi:hypothetical protein
MCSTFCEIESRQCCELTRIHTDYVNLLHARLYAARDASGDTSDADSERILSEVMDMEKRDHPAAYKHAILKARAQLARMRGET